MSRPNPPELHIPQFDMADRLYKALLVSGCSVQDMAEYLGRTRETVGRYRNGKSVPPLLGNRAWSMKTGVDFEWLRTGKEPVDAD
jgi:transcriptional regulator with XRE-family HTH domain